jgi:sulfur-carrier protein adenylyltransferase/sulfurtransferase
VDGVPLLPLSQINERFTELDPNQQYYLHCKAGVRSLKALNFLRQQGFKYLKSVKGGISAWSDEIDPTCRGTELKLFGKRFRMSGLTSAATG